MKKAIITSAIAFLACAATYASPKAIAYSENEIMSERQNAAKVKADLNKDGVTDLIVYNDKSLSIYFNNGFANYFPRGTFIIENEYADSRIIDVSVNAKGVVRIDTEWTNDRGASGSDTYVTRLQNNDFYLIGYDSRYNNPPTYYSFNLLTYKATTTSGYDEDTKRETKVLKRLPLKLLSEIKIGEYKCEDYFDY